MQTDVIYYQHEIRHKTRNNSSLKRRRSIGSYRLHPTVIENNRQLVVVECVDEKGLDFRVRLHLVNQILRDAF